MRNDVQAFVRHCIHCLSIVGGEMVHRPFRPAINGTMVNDLLKFYFIDTTPSTTGKKHVLMLRDDLFNHKWLLACHNKTAETNTKVIVLVCSLRSSKIFDVGWPHAF